MAIFNSVPQATPIVAPNLAQGSEPLKMDLSKAFAAAQEYGRMNPGVVQEALSGGGALSSALGFNSPVQVAGLSPSELLALTNGQGANQSLAQAGQNFDLITGGKESRDAQRTMAERLFSTGAAVNSQQATADLSAQSANAGNTLAVNTANAKGQLDAEQGNETLAETVRSRKANEDFNRKSLALKERELKYYQTALQSMQSTPATSLPYDTKLQSQYTDMAKYWGDEKKFGSNDSAAKTNKTIYEIYGIALGKPFGTDFTVGSASKLPAFQGAERVVMLQDGFHGVKQVNGKWVAVNANPILQLPGMPAPSGKGTAVGPKYAAE